MHLGHFYDSPVESIVNDVEFEKKHVLKLKKHRLTRRASIAVISDANVSKSKLPILKSKKLAINFDTDIKVYNENMLYADVKIDKRYENDSDALKKLANIMQTAKNDEKKYSSRFKMREKRKPKISKATKAKLTAIARIQNLEKMFNPDLPVYQYNVTLKQYDHSIGEDRKSIDPKYKTLPALVEIEKNFEKANFKIWSIAYNDGEKLVTIRIDSNILLKNSDLFDPKIFPGCNLIDIQPLDGFQDESNDEEFDTYEHEPKTFHRSDRAFRRVDSYKEDPLLLILETHRNLTPKKLYDFIKKYVSVYGLVTEKDLALVNWIRYQNSDIHWRTGQTRCHRWLVRCSHSYVKKRLLAIDGFDGISVRLTTTKGILSA